MNKKRFENVGKDIFQYSEWWCSAGGEHCADVITTAINELIEENEQLKQFIKQNCPMCRANLELFYKEWRCEND